jgi:Tol biopolymer transport system component
MLDTRGKVLNKLADPATNFLHIAFSPNGTQAVLSLADKSGNRDLWLLDLARDATQRFTFDVARDTNGVWPPDGSRIVFSSSRAGHSDLYWKLTSSVKDEEPLLKSSEDKTATSWSRDGRFLLYTVRNVKTKNDVWVLPLQDEHSAVPLLATQADEDEAQFAPDGRWLAYTSDESGKNEVYVRAVSPPVSTGSGFTMGG